jgi:hypothetical protein
MFRTGVDCERDILQQPLHVVVCGRVGTRGDETRMTEPEQGGFRVSLGGRPANIVTGPSPYCNSAKIVISFFDFNFEFSQRVPVPGGQAGELSAVSANLIQRIVMSPEHAKAFLELLQRNVAEYEGQFGQIKPVPQPESQPPSQENERPTP